MTGSVCGVAEGLIHTYKSRRIPVCLKHYNDPIPDDFCLIDNAGNERPAGRIVKLGNII